MMNFEIIFGHRLESWRIMLKKRTTIKVCAQTCKRTYIRLHFIDLSKSCPTSIWSQNSIRLRTRPWKVGSQISQIALPITWERVVELIQRTGKPLVVLWTSVELFRSPLSFLYRLHSLVTGVLGAMPRTNVRSHWKPKEPAFQDQLANQWMTMHQVSFTLLCESTE